MKPFTYALSIIFVIIFFVGCQVPFGLEQKNSVPRVSPLATKDPSIEMTVTKPAGDSSDENSLQGIQSSQYNLGKLFFARPDFYGWYSLIVDKLSDDSFLSNDVDIEPYTSRELVEGPGKAHQIIYSHYSDQMAILTQSAPHKLWVSDPSFDEPQLIFTDSEQRFISNDSLSAWGDLNLVWSPDDFYLFLYHKESSDLSLIYNFATGSLEPWYWDCNSVIISPKSDKLATLCPTAGATVGTAEYAIIEWGGEMWFTDSLPNDPFLQASSNDTMLWEWSPGGEMLAYFDPDDTEGFLIIADSKGNKTMLLPGISLFAESEIEGYQQYEFQTTKPFVWVNGGSILMVEGFDVLDKYCPKFISPYDPELDISSWPCWQAINVKSGDVIWNESDLANNLQITTSDDFREPIDMNINQVVGSPTSNMIAVQALNPNPSLLVVNLETGEAFTLSEYERYYELYWGN